MKLLLVEDAAQQYKVKGGTQEFSHQMARVIGVERVKTNHAVTKVVQQEANKTWDLHCANGQKVLLPSTSTLLKRFPFTFEFRLIVFNSNPIKSRSMPSGLCWPLHLTKSLPWNSVQNCLTRRKTSWRQCPWPH